MTRFGSADLPELALLLIHTPRRDASTTLQKPGLRLQCSFLLGAGSCTRLYPCSQAHEERLLIIRFSTSSCRRVVSSFLRTLA